MEKTEDILAKALKIALEKQEALRLKTEIEQSTEVTDGDNGLLSQGAGSSMDSVHSCEGSSPQNRMMISTPPPGVQTDSDGLILPKKVLNPCLENSDRKNLHRELMFNNKIGKNVLNQKSELQRALEKQKERQVLLQQQHQQETKTDAGLKGELNRVIMERAQKLEKQLHSNNSEQELDSQYVNPEYLSARAKLRAGRIEMK